MSLCFSEADLPCPVLRLLLSKKTEARSPLGRRRAEGSRWLSWEQPSMPLLLQSFSWLEAGLVQTLAIPAVATRGCSSPGFVEQVWLTETAGPSHRAGRAAQRKNNLQIDFSSPKERTPLPVQKSWGPQRNCPPCITIPRLDRQRHLGNPSGSVLDCTVGSYRIILVQFQQSSHFD